MGEFITASISGLTSLNKKLGEIAKRASGESRAEGVSVVADRLTEIGRAFAFNDFRHAYFEGERDVNVYAKYGSPNGEPWEIIAWGDSVIFIEFGTGFLLNDGDHPLSAQFGFTKTSWSATHSGYLIPPKVNQMKVPGTWPHREYGTTRWYHGNPPSKTMYYTAKLMRQKLGETVDEVWKRH